ncbi:small acid-soluble spore protein P [Paenibacillus sp. YN15]|nr:small acid-soluble spore protein P [Paenibacillus sp. YN15]RAU92462.1 small acid-soluble spore protein P [Paenibacillus sp. YN15]
MVKQKTNPVNPSSGEQRHGNGAGGPQEPLSGSKKVKNRNHTHKAPHEGS